MRIIILAAALISITLGIADIDRTIAAYNVTAYQNGKLSDIDVQELKSLDDSAIPEMIPLLEDKDEEVRKQTYIYLDAKRSTLKHKVIDKFDFRKFNFSRYRAYKVLSDNLDNLRP